MTQIIQICGPIGVGKSTLANELTFAPLGRYPNPILLPPRYATAIARHEMVELWLREPGVLRTFSRNKFTHRILFRSTETAWVEAYYRLSEEFPSFFSICANGFSGDTRSAEFRIHKSMTLFDTLRSYAACKYSSRNDAVAIHDESVAQRVLAVVDDRSDVTHFKRYFEMMPRPDAVIFLDAEESVILDRIEKRGKIAGRHRKSGINLAEDIAKMRLAFEIGRNVLARLDVPVIWLSADDEPSKLRNRALSMLSTCSRDV